jgi:uncharacterized LabA/DUF88 family protein
VQKPTAAQTNGFVAILWDVENVTPTQDGATVDEMVDLARRYGKLSAALAFANWRKPQVAKLDEVLSRASFQLVHVPKSRKNSADMAMITSAVETLFLYPHIDVFVLVTGDSDFRPLLVSVRKSGRRSVVVCDSRNASEDLLTLADEYCDYRDLLVEDVQDSGSEGETPKEPAPVSKDEAFALLAETVQRMAEDKKPSVLGPTKIRLTLLNPHFDESSLGFGTWKSFVQAATKAGFVQTESVPGDILISIPKAKTGRANPPEPFSHIKSVVAELEGERKGSRFTYAEVNNRLRQRGVDFHDFGYAKFAQLVNDAAKRGLVSTSRDGLVCYVESQSGKKPAT